MDLTTLALALVVAFGLLATDTVLHSGSVTVEVAGPVVVFRDIVDPNILESAFTEQLDQIASIQSVVNPPQIRSSHDDGIGMTLAEVAGVRPLAFSLQHFLGYASSNLRFVMFMERGKLSGVVSGNSAASGSFSQEFRSAPDEPLVNFVQRAANWGAAQLAPYNTALYLLQRHANDGDFRDVVALCNNAIARQSPAPVNPTRGQYENILGLVELFRNDPQAARGHFEVAAASWPGAPVPEMNIAFTELAADQYEPAARRMRVVLAETPPRHPAVLATAYVTLATALMGLHQYDEADAQLALAVQTNPDSSTAPDLWADLKELRGDRAEADRLRRQAQQNSAAFENFGEVAALYFAMSWRDNEKVSRSKFSNPDMLEFH